MAAANQRFSIRNYAATMRSPDVDPPQPPIPVRWFRWWADDLSIPAVNFSIQIPSLDVITTSSQKSPSNKIRSADEDFGSPIRERRKKIRTVAEIFASSSQIQVGKNGRKEKNACKPRMMSSTHIHSLRQPTHKKRFRKNAGVVESNKFEEVRTLSKGADFIKCQRRRTRRVTFSGKDDILGGSKKSSRMDHAQIKNPCENFSKVLIASSDSSVVMNSTTNREVDINAMAVDITDASSSKKEAALAVMIDLNQAVETNSDDENFQGTTNREASINSLPNTSTITPTGSSKRIDEVFISPPLNSQGLVVEVQMEMNMASGSDHVLSAQKNVESDIEVNHLEIMSKNVFDAGSYQRDHQSDWFLNQYHPEKIHHELNFIEITDSGSSSIRNRVAIEDVDGFSIPEKAYYLREICNVDCQVESASRPTLRLMGKNVVVDGSNRYCHACGRSRTDSDCRIGQSLFFTMAEKNIPKIWIQPQRSDFSSNFYDLKPRLSSNADESVGNYNSEVSFGTEHHYPTIKSYERSIGQYMMSGSNNSQHKSAGYELPIRYHDRGGLKPSQVQISATLPHWWNHLTSSPYSDPASPYNVHNLPPVQTSALEQLKL